MALLDVRTTLLSVFQFHLHVDGVIWPKRMNYLKHDGSYLFVGWQCDIQIAYGSLWKAFSGFGLSEEGQAATWLLTQISDLVKMQ